MIKGKIYIYDKYPENLFIGKIEYIAVDELSNTVALMETDSQAITWVTRDTLSSNYKQKVSKS